MNNNCILVLISGKNVNNYLRWMVKSKIKIIKLNKIKYNELEVVVNYKDYQQLKKYSKTYKVKIIKRYGSLRILELIDKNRFILVSIVLATLFLYFLSNIIFSIEVVYNDSEVVSLVKNELRKYGIYEYRFKRDYAYLDKVKDEILKNNKDKIEWLEIVENGTKYTVKLVLRQIEDKSTSYEYSHVVANKDAIITGIKAYSGEKVKDVNDYVKNGDVVVSGVLTKPDGELFYTKAEALIYGEVWYKIDVEYPYAYHEERVTGKSKDVLVINFLNKKIPLFSYSEYKEFKTKSKKLVGSNVVPISISFDRQYEVLIKDEIYTHEEAVSNGVEAAKKKLLENNKRIQEIREVLVLDKQTIDSKIKLNLFISVIEDVTKIVEVKIEDNEIKNEEVE